MYKKDKCVFVDIHSWVGVSFNAIHYYGSIVLEDKQKVKLKREITRDEAIELDKKDQDSMHGYPESMLWSNRNHWDNNYEDGEPTLTERFNTKQDVVEAALKYCKENHPNIEFLIEGGGSSCPQEVFYAKSANISTLNSIYKEYCKIGHIRSKAKEIDKFIDKWEKEARKLGFLETWE